MERSIWRSQGSVSRKYLWKDWYWWKSMQRLLEWGEMIVGKMILLRRFSRQIDIIIIFTNHLLTINSHSREPAITCQLKITNQRFLFINQVQSSPRFLQTDLEIDSDSLNHFILWTPVIWRTLSIVILSSVIIINLLYLVLSWAAISWNYGSSPEFKASGPLFLANSVFYAISWSPCRLPPKTGSRSMQPSQQLWDPFLSYMLIIWSKIAIGKTEHSWFHPLKLEHWVEKPDRLDRDVKRPQYRVKLHTSWYFDGDSGGTRLFWPFEPSHSDPIDPPVWIFWSGSWQ